MTREAVGSLAGRLRPVLIGWAAGWPTLTLVLLCLQPFTRDWPLPLRALVTAGAMAVLMNLISVPLVRSMVKRLQARRRLQLDSPSRVPCASPAPHGR
jgi:antibiotic biosynthesis monooxygenase (ABM) superfamily enzyme